MKILKPFGFDKSLQRSLIPHHEGAVVMAKDTLGKSKRTEIMKLAKGIISSQQTEINEMKKWRKAWYNK